MTVFKKKAEKIVEGYPIWYILRHRSVKGEIGLEIECEGNKFKKEGLPEWWTYHKDNSLRGKDNAEYVLAKPILFKEVPLALYSLWDMFTAYGTVLDEANRTSVHVHLNVQKFHMNRLTAFMALYFSVEELLTAWCGDHRVGNLFCLRARDASAIVSRIKRFIMTDGSYEFSEGMHYAGMNAQSIQKFGSLELRALRGVTDPTVILQWIEMLRHIYELSAKFHDPRDIPGMLSGEGALAYLDIVLGEKNAYVLKQGIDYTNDQIREALYVGIRLAQDLCYCRDWSLFKAAEVKDNDPFGRAKKPSGQIGVYASIPPLQILGSNESWGASQWSVQQMTPTLMPPPAQPILNAYSLEEEFPEEEEDEPMIDIDDIDEEPEVDDNF